MLHQVGAQHAAPLPRCRKDKFLPVVFFAQRINGALNIRRSGFYVSILQLLNRVINMRAFLLLILVLLIPINLLADTTSDPAEQLIQNIIHKFNPATDEKKASVKIVKKFPVIDNIIGLIVQLNSKKLATFYVDIDGKYFTTLLYDSNGNIFKDYRHYNNSTPQANFVAYDSKQLMKKILDKLNKTTNEGPFIINQIFPVIDHMQAFLIQSKNGCQFIYFVHDKGQYYTLLLFDADGNNFINRYRKKYMWFQTLNSMDTGIQQGINTNHLIFIFIDPNDPEGISLYQKLRPYVDKHKLTIRWILIANRKKSSLTKADMIYQHVVYSYDLGMNIETASWPETNLAKNWLEYDYQNQEGGMKQYYPIPHGAINLRSGNPGDYYSRINEDTNLAKTLSKEKKPILVYQNKKGKIFILTQLPESKIIDKFIDDLGPRLICSY